MSVYKSAHVNLYVKFRPHNHKQLLDQVLKYLADGIDRSQWTQAVDVGCGPGQSVALLNKDFPVVFGCDTSEDQIAKAKLNVPSENVHFSVS